MNRTFQQSYHIPGTLSANITITFTAHHGMQLLHVSACASNDSDATLIIGPSTDTDGYLEAAVIGDSGVPVEFDRDDFVNDQFPHIADGTKVVFTLDYDGAGGTAAHDVTIVATFAEG